MTLAIEIINNINGTKMITKQMIEEAYSNGLPELKKLFENLPKEDCLKGLGLMVIMSISIATINIVKEIVLSKTT